jgi:uncharacterized protein with GYD domain
MSAYIVLANFTDQGIKNVKDTVTRARAAAQQAGTVGSRFIGVWWTLGPYDLVAVIEAPDDATATRLMLATAMQGNVRTLTMRAFSEAEMENIVQGLP